MATDQQGAQGRDSQRDDPEDAGVRQRSELAQRLADYAARPTMVEFHGMIGGWPEVRAWVLSGEADPPSRDAYLALMVRGIGHVETGLEDDPDLLQTEVWQLFDAGPPVVKALLGSERYPPKELGWTQSLVRLARRGLLDGRRLHDEAVRASEQDWRSPGHRRWFHHLARLLRESHLA